MPNHSPHRASDAADSQLRQSYGSMLDLVCDQFEAAWRAGAPLSIAESLAAAPDGLQSGVGRHKILLELVLVDMEYRWRSATIEPIHGLVARPSAEDYAVAFPELKQNGSIPKPVADWAIHCREKFGHRNLESLPTRKQPTLSETTFLDNLGPVPDLPLNERYLDYEIKGILGQGAFAKVYYAQQISLPRLVALKVSLNRGNEARTMASLEHDHIVKVHQEEVDAHRNLRVLCLQYVSGTTLKDIISWRQEDASRDCDGASLLKAVDCLNPFPEPISPEVELLRTVIARQDAAQAVCWIGICLASALTTAHGRGILHRDIKPANVLVSQRGRCYLTDFNLSTDHRDTAEESGIGGTLAYMAPEHLEAFMLAPGSEAAPEVLQPADIYSLGVVLFEVLTGERPFANPDSPTPEALQNLATVRREQIPNCRSIRPDTAEALDHVVRRAMQAQAAERYTTAADFAEALTGAQEHHEMTQAVPMDNRWGEFARWHPVFTFVAVGTLANVACLLIVLGHQIVDIYDHVNVQHRKEFPLQLMLAMALPFIPTVFFLVAYFRPIARFWKKMNTSDWLAEEEVARWRQRIRWLPYVGVGVSLVGWIFGGLITAFAYGTYYGDVKLLPNVLLGLALAGAVACTYAYFVAESVSILILYLRMLAFVPTPKRCAQQELKGVRRRLKAWQFVAALLPLLGAVAVIYAPGIDDPADIARMRVFATSMIVLAVAGFAVSVRVGNLIHRALDAMGAE